MEVADELLDLWFSEGEEGDRLEVEVPDELLELWFSEREEGDRLELEVPDGLLELWFSEGEEGDRLELEVPDGLLELWFSEGEEGDRPSTGPSTNKTKRETNASLISILLRCNLPQSLLSYFYGPSSSVDGKLVICNICNSSIVKPKLILGSLS